MSPTGGSVGTMYGRVFGTDLGYRVTALEGQNVKFEYWAEISSGTSGTITPPTGSTILLDQYPGDTDALVSTVDTGTVPDGELALTAGGVAVTCTLTTGGAYVLSAAPASYPVAVVYAAFSPLTTFDYTKEYIGKPLVEASSGGDTWELIETITMNGFTELITVGSDDVLKLVYDGVGCATAGAKHAISFSQDSGSTYPSTHSQSGTLTRANSTTVFTNNVTSAPQFLMDDVATVDLRSGEVVISGITNAVCTEIHQRWWRLLNGTNIYQYRIVGQFATTGAIDQIKLHTVTAKQFTSGTVKVYKLLGPTP